MAITYRQIGNFSLNKNQNLGIINDKIAGGDRVYKLPKRLKKD